MKQFMVTLHQWMLDWNVSCEIVFMNPCLFRATEYIPNYHIMRDAMICHFLGLAMGLPNGFH